MKNDKTGFCPFCEQEYVVTDEIPGTKVTCSNPECEKAFVAAAAEEPSTPAADTEEPPVRKQIKWRKTCLIVGTVGLLAGITGTLLWPEHLASAVSWLEDYAILRSIPDIYYGIALALLWMVIWVLLARKVTLTESHSEKEILFAGAAEELVSEKEAAPPADTSGSKLRKIKEDGFQTVHPDTLIAHISRSPILGMLVIAVVLHVVLISALSIGNIMMCVEYKTFSVTGAVAEHAAVLQEQKVAEKKAERAKAQAAQKAKRAAQAESDPEKEPKRAGSQAAGKGQAAPEKSAIEKELEEISSERPAGSSLSLDDMDDAF